MSLSVLPWTRRVARATPTHRDRVVDGLRAGAMIGVVLGHWLVTGLAAGPDGALHQQSPLSSRPAFIPISWLLQTLGLFFFVSGYAAAIGLDRAQARTQDRARARTQVWDRTSAEWLAARMRRLAPPVVAFVTVWLLVHVTLQVAGVAGATRHIVDTLMISPLWFVLVLALLTLITPAVRAAELRTGPALALVPLLVVAAVDLARYAAWPTIPHWLTSANVLAGWLVPYLLGVALAHGHLRPRRTGITLILTGILAAALLVLAAGYPASAVGVPGDGRSNLNPPSLLTVALSLVQIGAALTAWRPLTRLFDRPAWWAGTVVLNLAAMTVFLWHQTALLLVAGAGHVLLGDPAGLIGSPADDSWAWDRLLWLPAFVTVLALLCPLLRRIERPTALRSTT